MLMARLVKCPHCKEEDNKDGMIKKVEDTGMKNA